MKILSAVWLDFDGWPGQAHLIVVANGQVEAKDTPFTSVRHRPVQWVVDFECENLGPSQSVGHCQPTFFLKYNFFGGVKDY